MRLLDLVERWRKRVRRFWTPPVMETRPLAPALARARAFVEEFLSTDKNPEH